MQKITPFLWFDHQAEEAARFYVSIFKNSRIVSVARYSEAGARASGRKKGSVMTVAFRLNGQAFTALNGGPVFKLTPAISFVVNCKDQKELDRICGKLCKRSSAMQCGWLTDKYGVSWQIVPTILGKLMSGRDPAKAQRVMQAILKMKKIDIATLKKAAKN